MLDPVTTTILVSAGVLVVVDAWLENRRAMPPVPENIDVNEILAAHYRPCEADRRLIGQCRQMLCLTFGCKTAEQLERTITEQMTPMTVDERIAFIRTLAGQAAATLGVRLNDIKVEYTSATYAGHYNIRRNTLHVNACALCDRAYLAETVRTIFHELKHAVQAAAIRRDGNAWGYPVEVRAAWAHSMRNYIPASVDPYGYFHQPIEIDAFGFENSIVPHAGSH